MHREKRTMQQQHKPQSNFIIFPNGIANLLNETGSLHSKTLPPWRRARFLPQMLQSPIREDSRRILPISYLTLSCC